VLPVLRGEEGPLGDEARTKPASRARAASIALLGLLLGACGEPPVPSAGHVEGPAVSDARVEARTSARRAAAIAVDAPGHKQILFGDLHVHTTYSIDAFMYALPILGGEGAHPPADACDFARWCSGLDFFSINDHAEGLSPAMWRSTRESIRECNARAGDAAAPDLVAFLGWEWTQVGETPADHYGHKNVIFPGLADDEVPARPIASIRNEEQARPPLFVFGLGAAAARAAGADPYAVLLDRMSHLATLPSCPAGVDTRELPPECQESAETPAVLFRKLDEWGFPSLVIPHGLAWGTHTPPGYDFATQLNRAQHDPAKQSLIEVASGHGNGEEYRPALDAFVTPTGEIECPAPTEDFLPCCWRAGELMGASCGDLPADECERRVEDARRFTLEAGARGHLVLPWTEPEDWLDCDQCRDCFKPASYLRPRLTAQYGAAIGNFDEPEDDGRPLRFRFGFIASTDNHAGRPGTGYKQHGRKGMSDQRGAPTPEDAARLDRWGLGIDPDNVDEPVPYEPSRIRELFDRERNASFLYPGGLVAVHARGRDRASIWDALERREVYGTSGPKLLLWFDLVNGPAGRLPNDPKGRYPMGSEVAMDAPPRFEVRAAGAFEQRPGCPAEAEAALSPERLAALCMGECEHPGERRHRIEAIEVVRIQPQARADEPVVDLIQDPWLRLPCPPDPGGCRVTFEDPDFARDTVYYVRALQEPTPAINGDPLRPERDAEGRVVAVRPCFGSHRTPDDDACLSPVRERAWSSPIYVDRARR
jgi:hypothetical protein